MPPNTKSNLQQDRYKTIVLPFGQDSALVMNKILKIKPCRVENLHEKFMHTIIIALFARYESLGTSWKKMQKKKTFLFRGISGPFYSMKRLFFIP